MLKKIDWKMLAIVVAGGVLAQIVYDRVIGPMVDKAIDA